MGHTQTPHRLETFHFKLKYVSMHILSLSSLPPPPFFFAKAFLLSMRLEFRTVLLISTPHKLLAYDFWFWFL